MADAATHGLCAGRARRAAWNARCLGLPEDQQEGGLRGVRTFFQVSDT